MTSPNNRTIWKRALLAVVLVSIAAAIPFAVSAESKGAKGKGLAKGHDKVDPTAMFVIKTTTKTPDQVSAALKKYVDDKKWIFAGATKVKKNEVILFKACIPAVGQQLWPQGMYLSAMLPCSNVGIYTKDGKTEVSMLKASYMHKLVPTADMEDIADATQPLLDEMLETALK